MTALEAAAALIASHPADRRILIGICGAPGSGKSTFAAALAARVGGMVLPMDGFHLPQARLVELGRRERMGAPDTFDVDGFVTLLGSLRDAFGRPGEPLRAPGFDRTVEESQPGAIPIEPGVRILILEGNYLLHDADGWERVAPLLDATIYVHLDHVTRHDRLIARHIAFGKTPVAAREWALGTDERNALLIAAGAPRADLVLELD